MVQQVVASPKTCLSFPDFGNVTSNYVKLQMTAKLIVVKQLWKKKRQDTYSSASSSASNWSWTNARWPCPLSRLNVAEFNTSLSSSTWRRYFVLCQCRHNNICDNNEEHINTEGIGDDQRSATQDPPPLPVIQQEEDGEPVLVISDRDDDDDQSPQLLQLGNSAILSACCVGLFTGITVVLFNYVVHEIRDLCWDGIRDRGASWLREEPVEAKWGRVILVPAFGGLMVSLLNMIRTAVEDSTDGTVISNIKSALKPILKTVAACVTLGTGNSLGPEGPSVEIGVSVAKGVGALFDKGAQRKLSLRAAGSAAGLSSGFNAAVAGCFFAVESVLWPSPAESPLSLTNTTSMVILSAVIASVISEIGLGSEPAFAVPLYDFRSPSELPLYLLLGVLCGLVSVGLSKSTSLMLVFFDGLQKVVGMPKAAFPVLGGLSVGLIALVYPEILYWGFQNVDTLLESRPFMNSLSADLLLQLLAAKILATSLCRASGLVGGYYAPSLFIGAATGMAYGKIIAYVVSESNPIFHLSILEVASPQAYGLVGMAATLAGVCQVPLTAVLLLFELTQDYRIVLPLLGAVGLSSWITSDKIRNNSKRESEDKRNGISTPMEKYSKEELSIKSDFDEQNRSSICELESSLCLNDDSDDDEVENLGNGILVSQAMRTKYVTIFMSTSLADVVSCMLEEKQSCAVIVDDKNQLIGQLTLTDIQRFIELSMPKNRKPQVVSVYEAWSFCGESCSVSWTASPSMTLSSAVSLMNRYGLNQLPVILEQGNPVGLIDTESINLAISSELPLYLLLGVLCGLVSVGLSKSTSLMLVFFDGLQKVVGMPKAAFPVLGGLSVGLIALVYPEILYWGFQNVDTLLESRPFMNSLSADLLLQLLAAKILATSLCRASGLVGGYYAPSLFIGAATGMAYGKIIAYVVSESNPIFHLSILEVASPQAYGLVGMAATLAGVCQVPLTAVLLLFELTQDYRIVLPLLGAVGLSSWITSDKIRNNSKRESEDKRNGISTPMEKYSKEELSIKSDFDEQNRSSICELESSLCLNDDSDDDEVENLGNGILVSQAMRTKYVTIFMSTSLADVVSCMLEEKQSCAVIVDDKNQLIGQLTLTDIQRFIELSMPKNRKPQVVSVYEAWSFCGESCSVSWTASPSMTLSSAVSLMNRYGLNQLPVILEQGNPVGLIDTESINLAISSELPLYLLLGVLCGLVSVGLSKSTSLMLVFFDGLQKVVGMPKAAFPVLGGLSVGLIALVYPEILYWGFQNVDTLLESRPFMNSLSADLLLQLLAAKILATSLCRASGLVGGYYAPSLFIGAATGMAYGKIIAYVVSESNPIFHLSILEVASPQAYGLVGMAATLAGVCQVPLTAVLLLFELTQDYRIVLPLLGAVGLSSWITSDKIRNNSKRESEDKRNGISTPMEKYSKEELSIKSDFDEQNRSSICELESSLCLNDDSDDDEVENLGNGILVSQAMRTKYVTIFMSTSLADVVSCMLEEKQSCAVIVDDKNQLIGQLTLTDIQRFIELSMPKNRKPQVVSVYEAWSFCGESCSVSWTASPSMTLSSAVSLMNRYGLNQLPVILEQGNPVGLIDTESINLAIRAFAIREGLKREGLKS